MEVTVGIARVLGFKAKSWKKTTAYVFLEIYDLWEKNVCKDVSELAVTFNIEFWSPKLFAESQVRYLMLLVLWTITLLKPKNKKQLTSFLEWKFQFPQSRLEISECYV